MLSLTRTFGLQTSFDNIVNSEKDFDTVMAFAFFGKKYYCYTFFLNDYSHQFGPKVSIP